MKYTSSITASGRSDTYELLYQSFGKYGVPRIPEYIFDPSFTFVFEEEFFDAPKEYDVLLRGLYADYMTLPPKEKQISQHKYICYLKEDINK